jgi:hypothetical protein
MRMYWIMLDINGMRSPFKIVVVFFVYGDDVLYFYYAIVLSNGVYLL